MRVRQRGEVKYEVSRWWNETEYENGHRKMMTKGNWVIVLEEGDRGDCTRGRMGAELKKTLG